MTTPMNPNEALKWPSVKCLLQHLEDVRMVVATGVYNPDISWESVCRDNLVVFEDAISSMPEDGSFRHNVYRVLMSCLLKEYNEWTHMLEPLEGHPEISLCRDSIDLIIKYVAVCYQHTVFDDAYSCLYFIGKEVNEIDSTFRRDCFLRQIAGHLGIKDDLARRQKCDQCNRCKVRNCDGRYWDGLCGIPDLVGGKCDDLIISQDKNDIAISPNKAEEDVMRVEDPLKDLSKEQKRLLKDAVFFLTKKHFCDEKGHFNNKTISDALNSCDDYVFKGSPPYGQMKGLFADAVLQYAKLGKTWKVVNAIFHEANLGQYFGDAILKKADAKNAMCGIVKTVFPNYTIRETK